MKKGTVCVDGLALIQGVDGAVIWDSSDGVLRCQRHQDPWVSISKLHR
jgi:hypothetical protein